MSIGILTDYLSIQMSANNPKKRQRKRFFDDLSSNSEAEPDTYEDKDGDYGSVMNYEPQQTDKDLLILSHGNKF